jgi:Protein of Unknown function (DUF2784)
MNHQLLADAVLLAHFAVVLFVVLGLPVIILGNHLGWGWVNRRSWRMAHLLAIAVVVVQAWLGRYCALTDLESWLRGQAGQAAYERSFVQHWVSELLYVDAPLWMFALAYTVFAAVVIWAWWRYPPRSNR